MKMKLLSLTLLAVALAVPVSSFAAEPAADVRAVQTSAPDPAQEISNLAHLFRNGDLAGLAQAMTPRSRWAAVRAAYEVKRQKPTSESDRAEFAAKIGKFTAPDAVDQMMAKIEPELAKARPQLPGMLLMGFGALQVAIKSPDAKLTDEQRKALENAMPGLQRWATSTDLLSSNTMRNALTLLTDAARRTGITDIDQIKALPLEGVLERAGPMLVAAKDAVRSYGIDLDAVADSLRVEVLDQGRDTARVRTTVTVFGAPVSAEHDLVLVEGHWYGKHAMAEFDDMDVLDG
jgi:hypothetical protein